LWEFPGGKLRPQETHQQALAREILEELSVEITDLSFLGSSIHHYPNLTINLHCYVVSAWVGEFALTDHDAMQWYGLPQLEEIKLCDADLAFKPLIRAYLEAL